MAPATAKISYSSVEKWPFILFLTSFLNKFANWHLLARKTEDLRFTIQQTYFKIPLTMNKCRTEAINFLTKLIFVSLMCVQTSDRLHLFQQWPCYHALGLDPYRSEQTAGLHSKAVRQTERNGVLMSQQVTEVWEVCKGLWAVNWLRRWRPGSAPTWEGRSAPSCCWDGGRGMVDPVNKLWDFIILLDDGLKDPQAVSKLMQMHSWYAQGCLWQ